jgi:hypothetical protein
MSARAWEAFVVNWLFWSGIAVGALVLSALLELTDARWAGDVRLVAERFRRFLPISLIAFGAQVLHRRDMYGRSAVAAAATYAVAFWFCRTSETTQESRTRASITFLIVYVAAFSLIAHDVIMSLEPTWISTLFPAYAFMANVYGGIAAVALVSLMSASGRRVLTGSRLRDLSMVLVGFGILWMYLVWCQFLVVWYGNLPEETAFVARRAEGVWRMLAWVVLMMRGAFPVLVLLADGGKHKLLLAISAALVLVGFWIEDLLLVGPAMPGMDATSAVLFTTAFGVAFAGSVVPLSPRAQQLPR